MLADRISKLFCVLVRLLRNGVFPSLSREEIRYLRPSFSQNGEDIIVEQLLASSSGEPGVYLDLGAFHPAWLSNTLLLYKQGWRGINVDTNPEKLEAFFRLRPGDFNICATVGESSERLSIQDVGLPTERVSDGEGEAERDALSVIEIINRSPYSPESIDFFNIDLEGCDVLALQQGFEETRFSPRIVCVESHTQHEADEADAALFAKGYFLASIAIYTRIYAKR